MAGLRRLTGDDSAPQAGAAPVVLATAERPVVEVVADGAGMLLDTPQRPVVEVAPGDGPTVLHVVEPVYVAEPRLALDDLTDVETDGATAGVAYALRRDDGDAPFTLVPTVDGQDTVLRPELGARNGVAQLDALGVLRADQRPPLPPTAALLDETGVLRADQRPPLAAREYRHLQLPIAALWQIPHGLGFDPAGIYIEDQDGNPVEPERISYVIPGQILEITFGLPVHGTARLS